MNYVDAELIRWKVIPEHSETLKRFCLSESCKTGKIVKSSPARTIFRIPIQEKEYIVKIYHTPLWTDFVRDLFFPRITLEWNHLNTLKGLGFPVPTPIAMGRRGKENYLLLEKLSGVESLHRLCREDVFPRKKESIQNLARLVSALHNRRFFHDDFHAGNIMVNRQAEVYLVDLYEISSSGSFFPGSVRKKCRKNLAMLGSSFLEHATHLDYFRFFKEYLQNTTFFQGKSVRKEFDRVGKWMRQHEHRVWLKKSKRCWRENKYFSRLFLPSGRGFIRKEEEHRKDRLHDIPSLVEKGRILKDSRTTLVVKTDCGVLKQYRRKKMRNWVFDCFRPSRGKRAWIASHHCQIRGIRTAPPIAFWERRTGIFLHTSCFLTQEVKNSSTLYQYLDFLTGCPIPESVRRKKDILFELGRFVRILHQRGLSHRDLKCNNWLVDENRHLCLVDMDGLQVKSTVRIGRRRKDIGRLIQSLRKAKNISRLDIMRFMDAYMPFSSRRKQVDFLRKTIDAL